MLNQLDVDYLLQREAEERQRAASALDPSVQLVHLELAERYADAAWAAEEQLDCPVRASGLWQRHDSLQQRVSAPTPS